MFDYTFLQVILYQAVIDVLFDQFNNKRKTIFK